MASATTPTMSVVRFGPTRICGPPRCAPRSVSRSASTHPPLTRPLVRRLAPHADRVQCGVLLRLRDHRWGRLPRPCESAVQRVDASERPDLVALRFFGRLWGLHAVRLHCTAGCAAAFPRAAAAAASSASSPPQAAAAAASAAPATNPARDAVDGHLWRRVLRVLASRHVHHRRPTGLWQQRARRTSNRALTCPPAARVERVASSADRPSAVCPP